MYSYHTDLIKLTSNIRFQVQAHYNQSTHIAQLPDL